MTRSDGNRAFWWKARLVAVVGALVIAGCSGGGGTDDGSSNPRSDGTTELSDDTAGGTLVDVSDGADDEEQISAGEPVSHLPFDAAAPDGYRMVAGECEANAMALAAAKEAGESIYASPLVFAVPDDWTHGSKGSGGSGGITGTDVDLGFRTDAGEVEVAFEWDNRNADNEILDGDNEVWTSFDRETDHNGSIVTIEYERVATGVAVGDQSVDIFYRDPSQDPERFDGEEYKARVEAFDLPNSPFMRTGGIDKYSLVFTITFDSDNTEVDVAMIEAIIGSVNLPTCVWDDLLLSEEVQRQADLNGDGQVKTMEEWQADMMKDLEEITASAED